MTAAESKRENTIGFSGGAGGVHFFRSVCGEIVRLCGSSEYTGGYKPQNRKNEQPDFLIHLILLSQQNPIIQSGPVILGRSVFLSLHSEGGGVVAYLCLINLLITKRPIMYTTNRLKFSILEYNCCDSIIATTSDLVVISSNSCFFSRKAKSTSDIANPSINQMPDQTSK